jgi:uncharacterized protein
MNEPGCLRCGACCRVEGYVRLEGDEPDRMAAFLGLTVPDFTRAYTRLTRDRAALSLVERADGACVFLAADGDACLVHAVKPRQCREFPRRWAFAGYERVCAAARAAAEGEGRTP